MPHPLPHHAARWVSAPWAMGSSSHPPYAEKSWSLGGYCCIGWLPPPAAAAAAAAVEARVLHNHNLSATFIMLAASLPHRPWGPPIEPTVKERLHLEVQAGSGRFFDIFKPVVFGRRGLRLPRCARCHVSLHARKRRPRGAPAKNTRTARNADKQKRRGGAAGLPRTQPRLLGCGKGPSPHARTRTHTGTRTHARCRDGVAADRPHRRRCRRLRRR